MIRSGAAFTLASVLLVSTSFASGIQDFSGTWTFDPGKSRDIGMMSQMRMTTVIEQSPEELRQKIDATMMGQNQKQELQFDLTGKPVTNETFMGEKSETVTRWQGPKLVITWTTPGAIAGSKKVMVETRYLSADGKTMSIETTRTGKTAIVMVYDKK